MERENKNSFLPLERANEHQSRSTIEMAVIPASNKFPKRAEKILSEEARSLELIEHSSPDFSTGYCEGRLPFA